MPIKNRTINKNNKTKKQKNINNIDNKKKNKLSKKMRRESIKIKEGGLSLVEPISLDMLRIELETDKHISNRIEINKEFAEDNNANSQYIYQFKCTNEGWLVTSIKREFVCNYKIKYLMTDSEVLQLKMVLYRIGYNGESELGYWALEEKIS